MSVEDVRAVLAEAEPFYGPEANDRALADEPRNDYGNGRRLCMRFGPDLIWIESMGWLVWDGARWKRAGDPPAAAWRYAHDVAMAIRAEADAVAAEGRAQWGAAFDDLPEKEASADMLLLRKKVEGLHKWAIASGNTGKVKAMLESAAPYLVREAGDMDADPGLLCCANGTLELDFEAAQVRLRRHDRADLITRQAAVEYDPKAEAPLWQSFLEMVLPDPEVRLFVQTFLGYCLTGDTGEQVMLICHGGGGNGKSTLLEVVAAIMGDFAAAAAIQTFLHDDRKGGGDATPDIARLVARRLVLAAEPDMGVKLSESRVKTITGGEQLTARHLHREFFEFEPDFKLVISCNHKPVIRGQDDGIWRRVVMVPFTETIPKSKRDKRLKAKLLREAAGILNWLLDGFRIWCERGLVPPDAVREATDTYRAESDPVGEFLRTCVSEAPGTNVPAARLFDAYVAWAKTMQVEAVSQTLFGRKMADRGYHKKKMGIVYYEGLDLNAEGEGFAVINPDGPPPGEPEDYGM